MGQARIEKSPTLLGFWVRWPTCLVVLPDFCAGCSRVLAYLYGKPLAGHTVWLMQRWASGSVGWALHSPFAAWNSNGGKPVWISSGENVCRSLSFPP